MLNFVKQKNTLFTILLVLVIWIWIPISFQLSIWPLSALFGDIEHLEGIFSPADTLFSAFASVGAIYAIYSQFKTFNIQQFESNFFNMLSIHRSNRDSIRITLDIKSPKQSPTPKHYPSRARRIKKVPLPQQPRIFSREFSDIEAFYALYELFRTIATKAGLGMTPSNNYFCTDKLEKMIGERFDPLRNESGEFQTSMGRAIFIATQTVFDEYTNRVLYHYFRHLYHMVKYVHCATISDKKKYIGILRAQLSVYEHVLLYYNALANTDFEEGTGKSKFQLLIEEYELMHNVEKVLCFDCDLAGSYAPSAYGKHNGELDSCSL